MKMPRMTIAPTIPQNSTRCWYSRLTPKYVNKARKTNRLSTDSDCSMRNAVT